eukprot:1152944-Amorphochlora_amoeboformis.AAC.1
MATAEYAEVPPAAAVVISGAGEEGEDANGAYAARVVWEGPKLPLQASIHAHEGQWGLASMDLRRGVRARKNG